MKPNFNAIPRSELLAYLKEHREDDAAWGIYLDGRNPNSQKYPAPLDEESIKITEEAIRQKIQEIENRKHRR